MEPKPIVELRTFLVSYLQFFHCFGNIYLLSLSVVTLLGKLHVLGDVFVAPRH